MMRRNRLTQGEIEAEMRHASIAHLKDVAWGILETDGKISFIKRSGKQPDSAQDDSKPAG